MNIPTTDSLRVQVNLVDNQPRVTLAETIGDKSDPGLSQIVDPSKARKRKKRKKSDALVIPRGSLSVRIYNAKNGDYRSHTLVYYEGGKRRREVRASLEEAKDLAEVVLTRLANGPAALAPQDQASYLRAKELLAPSGQSLELAAANYAECYRLSKGDPLGYIKFAAENRPKDGELTLSLSKLVEQFLADKKADIGERWYRTLEHHLERFASHFAKHCTEGQEAAPLSQLSSADLNAFLRELGVGGRSRHNYRAAVDQLVRWARGNGHLSKAWSEMESVPDPGARFEGEIKILTPKEMTQLLAARQVMEQDRAKKKTFIPFLVLQAFAGVRHEEIQLLDWRDIHLSETERYIFVPREIDKTGRGRVVPICENLAAWLIPHAKANGKVCEISNSAHALADAKRAAGLASGKNETRNILRKSFISYRLSLIKNVNQVAEEAGNSPAKIRSNYNRPIPESEAKRWFNLWPTTAEVIQLNFGFK